MSRIGKPQERGEVPENRNRGAEYAQIYGEPLNYPVEVAAWTLGIGRSTIWELIRKGLIGTVKIGRRRFVPREEVHRARRGLPHSNDGG